MKATIGVVGVCDWLLWVVIALVDFVGGDDCCGRLFTKTHNCAQHLSLSSTDETKEEKKARKLKKAEAKKSSSEASSKSSTRKRKADEDDDEDKAPHTNGEANGHAAPAKKGKSEREAAGENGHAAAPAVRCSVLIAI